jgi:F0F1-type ATP synthase assembly protein I
LLGAKLKNAMLRRLGKPIRTVLRWQLWATAILTLAAGLISGVDGALSAALGGLVSVVAGLVAAKARADSAGGVIVGALTAEGVKIVLIVILLGLVLMMYKGVVAVAFIGAFIVTLVIFALAFFVRDY